MALNSGAPGAQVTSAASPTRSASALTTVGAQKRPVGTTTTKQAVGSYPPGGEDFRGGSAAALDALIISGVTFAGFADVEGTIKQRSEKKSTAGKSGATTTLHGWDTWEGSFEFTLWTEEHFKSYAKLLELVHAPEAKGPPQPVEVWHWKLALMRVTKVLVLGVGLPRGRGQVKVKWDCREFTLSSPRSASALSTPKKTSKSLGDLGPGALDKKDAPPRPSAAGLVP